MAAHPSSLCTAFAGLVAMAAVMGIGHFVYTLILPYMAESMPLSENQAGMIAAANFLGYLLGSLAAGTGFLSGNRRNCALWALGPSVITTGAMALTVSIPAFLVLRFTGGVCSALVMVFGSALVLDRLTAARRPHLSHIHFAGVGTGMAVSAIVVVTLGTMSVGWTEQWLASALVALIGLVYIFSNVAGGRRRQRAAGNGWQQQNRPGRQHPLEQPHASLAQERLRDPRETDLCRYAVRPDGHAVRPRGNREKRPI